MATPKVTPGKSGTFGKVIDVGEHTEECQATLTGVHGFFYYDQLEEVSAPIPSWVSGILLRNGPGLSQIGPDEYEHLFDGMALIQKWTLKDGKVSYKTRFLRSAAFERNTAANRIVVSEFGTSAHPDPCKTLFQRYFSYAFPFSEQVTDNALVNVIQTGDQVYAMTETPVLCRIDPQTLETKQNNINVKRLVAVNSQTAHSHYTPEGDLINVGTGNGSYHILKVDKPPANANDNSFDHIRIGGSIKFEHALYPSYYHSFGMTRDKIIFPEMPLRLSVPGMLARLVTHQSFKDAMQFTKTDKTRFHILDLKTCDPVKCPVLTADAFFTFHHINAFEENKHLVVDLCGYPDTEILNALTLKQIKHMHPAKAMGELSSPAKFWRFVLPLVVPDSAKPGDNLLDGSKYGNAKAFLQADGSVHCSHHVLYKMDASTGDVKVWQKDDNSLICGEPVFIPKPGVVIAPVSSYMDEADSFLVVLNAEDFTEISRAHVKPTVPFGFHAHYVSTA